MSEQETYNFDNLVKMLTSQSVDDQILALQCVEHMERKKNMVAILLLFKKCHTVQMWTDHAPTTMQWLSRHLKKKQIEYLTYKDIMDILISEDVKDRHQMEIFIRDVNNTLKETLIEYGFSFIEDVQITIKNPAHEQQAE